MTEHSPIAEASAPSLATPGLWPLVMKNGLVGPRIHVLSDLHLDMGPYALPADLEYDILVAAGDIGPLEISVPWLASLGKPVVYVMGNHEHYDRVFTQTVAHAKALAAGSQVHVLERESITLMGVQFLGATLWTSFGDWQPELVAEAHRRMSDYAYIRAGAWRDVPANEAWLKKQCKKLGRKLPERTLEQPDAFHPAMSYREHLQTVAWLKKALQKTRSDRPTVVVTHQAPVFQSLLEAGIPEELLDPAVWDRRYRSEHLVRVAAYASQLEPVLRQYANKISLWAHGHLHRGMDFLNNGVRVLCNPRGHHMPALTQRSLDTYALYGMRLTQADVERSQEAFAKDPYQGDAYYFDRDLVVRLEDGPRRPIELAVVKPLEKLRELHLSADGYVPFVFKGHAKQREAVVRAFSEDCRKFRETLQVVHKAVSLQLDDMFESLGIRRLPAPYSEPYEPWAIMNEQKLTPDSYAKIVTLMGEWITWIESVHLAVPTRLTQWASRAYHALALLDSRGIAATVRRPPVAALRTMNVDRIYVFVDQSEEVCNELEAAIDKLLNPRIPRHWSICVWQLADRSEKEPEGLALKDLAPWCAPLPSAPEPVARTDDANW